MINDVTDYLIILVGALGTITILLNIVILKKLGNSSLKRFGLQVLGLMIIFSVAGFMRSIRALFENESFDSLVYVEYAIYSMTYIAAFYKLHQMQAAYGFSPD